MVVIHFAEAVIHGLHMPALTFSLIVVLALAGLPIVLLIAWAIGNKKSGEVAVTTLKKPNWVKIITASVISVVLFAASILIYNKFFYHSKFTGKEKSIAVLPFTNMSNDTENETFSIGISSEITSQLTKIGSLDVRASSSTIRFKNEKIKTLKEMAAELNAEAIVSGQLQFQKEKNRIRIHVELTDANTSKRIWGNEYDREWKDIFAIQSEVAKEIAYQLNARLTKDEKKKIDQKPTENLQAYEYYLQGKQILEKFRSTLKQESFTDSKEMFEKAIAFDPEYALAHAGLANLYNIYTDLVKSDSGFINLQLQEIEKAYSLGPDLDYVNSTRGAIYRIALDNLEESYKSFRKAYEINPNNTSTLFDFGMLMSDLGLYDERIALLQKAVRFDPLNSNYFGFLGGAKIHLNKLDDGIRDLKISLRLEPDMFYVVDRIAYAYALQNNLKDCDTWLKKFINLIPAHRETTFYPAYGQYAAYCYAKLGNKNRALELSKSWRVYLALGMKEEALQSILKQKNNDDYLIFKTHLEHKDFDIIRSDPRFLEMMEEKRIQYEISKRKFSVADLLN